MEPLKPAALPAAPRSRGSLDREAIISTLFDLFRERGYDGVSISDVSAATGLGKSSLYHHFPGGKEDMAQAVLGVAETWLEGFAAGLAAAPDRAALIRALVESVSRLFHGGSRACVMASLLLGDPAAVPSGRLKNLLGRWIQGLAAELVRTGSAEALAGRQAVSAIIRIEGALMVARALGDSAAFAQALAEVEADLRL